ncbi:hypothetical protein FQ192_22140 [Pseudomonas sp. ANT_J12]|uniref:hypothetical protein n=1 Tax=Pseudomonas sp. ANT_J12 TaxID=2597351 RepID=UPI0011F12A8B|nr:hypothetical protein [Pseudomonas sp. ANT_J12]KAA0987332.1 hypothetical protein FQ192_22140 [Pseudomonas sp. ANT_J12]
MNAESRVKIRRLAANADVRKRVIGAFWRRQMLVRQTAEYRIALLHRYPAGLVNDAEIEALLESWPLQRTLAHTYSAAAA